MKIILFRGRPGSGKTTVANLLSKETDIPILRKDDIYDVTSEFVEGHQTKNKIAYGSLYAILESNKQTDCVFILDCGLGSPEDFSIIKQWCSDRGVELKSVVVTCSDESLWAERFNIRSDNPKPNQLLTNFEDMKKHYGSMQVVPEEEELLIDTAKSNTILLGEIKNYIL